MHSKSCARQLYWGLIWVAAPFHAHLLWLELGSAPWDLRSQVMRDRCDLPSHLSGATSPRTCVLLCVVQIFKSLIWIWKFEFSIDEISIVTFIHFQVKTFRSVVSSPSSSVSTSVVEYFWTNADSQWNPVYNVFHRKFGCGNKTIRR